MFQEFVHHVHIPALHVVELHQPVFHVVQGIFLIRLASLFAHFLILEIFQLKPVFCVLLNANSALHWLSVEVAQQDTIYIQIKVAWVNAPQGL